MATNNLQELNNSQFSDSPVASEQIRENTNPPPIDVQSIESQLERNDNQPTPRNQQPNNQLSPYSLTGGDVESSQEMQSRLGYRSEASEYGDGTGIFQTPYGDNYFDAKWLGINFGPVTDAGSDPYRGLNTLGENTDFEHVRRGSQSTAGAGVNIATQFVGKTLVNTVGGVVGGFYSLGSAVANWDSGYLYDNSVNRALDRATEAIEEGNTVFTSQRARDRQGVIGFNVETMKNLSDGYSFVAGAVLSEVLTGGLASASIAASGLRLAARLNKIQRLPVAAAISARSLVTKGHLPSLRASGQVIKRAEDALESVNNTNKLANTLSAGERQARLADIFGNTTGVIDDVQRYASALKDYSNLGKFMRTTITGSFWEGGLEARQNKDEFIESNMALALKQIDSRTDLTEEQKAALKQEKALEIERLAENVGLLTFGLNVAVLRTSNAVQFPTLFGTSKRLNPTKWSGKFKKLPGGKFEIPKSVKVGDALRYFRAISKNALTEGAEELTQGIIGGSSQEYYNDILKGETSNHLLHDNISNFFNAAINTAKEQSQEKEFWTEGAIGAIMGFTGIPMLKRNKKGKLRSVKMQGGIWDDVKGVNDYRKERRVALSSLDNLNNEFDSITGYNVDRAKRMELLNRRDDLAVLTDNEQEFLDNRQHKFYNLVTDMKNKGLESYLYDTLEAIEAMNLDEYNERFGGEGNITQQEMELEKKDVRDSIDNWSNAYDLVYDRLRMDDVSNSKTNSKMFDLLVHSVGFDKYLNNQLEGIRLNLINSGFFSSADLTETELDEMVRSTIEYKTILENFNFKIDELIDKEYNSVIQELTTTEYELQDTLNKLPTDVRIEVMNKLQQYNELVNTGKLDDANVLMGGLLSSLSTAENLKNASFNGVSLKSMLETALDKKVELTKKKQGLDKDSKSFRDTVIDKNKETVTKYNKELQEEVKKLNELVKEKHEKDTELFLNKEKAQQVSLADILKATESSRKFRLHRHKAFEAIEKGKSLMDGLQKDAIDINNELEKYEIIYAKKLSTLRLAAQLLEVSPREAYRKTAFMDFDANLMELIKQFQDLKYDFDANLMEVGIDRIAVDVTYLKDAYDRVTEKLNTLIEDFNFKESHLKSQRNYLKSVKAFMDRVNSHIKALDEQEAKADTKAEKEADNAMKDGAKAQEERKKNTDNAKKESTKKQSKEKEEAYKENDPGFRTNRTTKRNREKPTKTEKEQKDEDALDEVTDSVVKPFYTIYPSDKTSSANDTGNNDLDGKSLADKVNDGTVKYNQLATLDIDSTDETTDSGFLNDAKNKGIDIDSYKRGRELVQTLIEEGNIDDLLNLSYSDLESYTTESNPEAGKDIIAYISFAQIHFNIYDSQVKISSRGTQTASTEGAELLHSMFFYSPEKNTDERETELKNTLDKKIRELSVKFDNQSREIFNDDKLDDTEKIERVSRLRTNLDRNIRSLRESAESSILDKNFYTNFELRKRAIIEHYSNNGEALQLRIGNFLNGLIQPSQLDSTSSDYVRTFSLISSESDNHPLIDDLDNFDLNNLLFINTKGEFVNMSTDKVTNLNTGSLVDKQSGNSGEVYLQFTTQNGQKIPIKLNRDRFNLHPEIHQGIMEMLDQYYSVDNLENRPDAKPDLSGTALSVFNGKTYKEIFTALFRRSYVTGKTVNSNSMGTLTAVDKTGVIYFGGTPIKSAEEYNNNKADIESRVGNTRSFLHAESVRNSDGGNLNDIGKWFITTNLVSHTFTTNDTDNNVDSIFQVKNDEFKGGRDTSKAIPFQVHILNADIGEVVPRNTKTDNQLRDLNTVFTNGRNKRNYKDFKVSELNKYILNDILDYLEDNGLEITEETVNEAIKELVDFKREQLRYLLDKYPGMGGNNNIAFNFIRGKERGGIDRINDKDLKILRDSNNSLDNYLFHFIAFTNKLSNLKTSKVRMLSSYSGRLDLINTIRRELVTSGRTTSLGGVVFKATDSNEIRSVNTATPETAEINKLTKEIESDSISPELREKKIEQRKELVEQSKAKLLNVVSSVKNLGILLNHNINILEKFSNNNDKLNSSFLFNGKVGRFYKTSQSPFSKTTAYTSVDVPYSNEIVLIKVNPNDNVKDGEFAFKSFTSRQKGVQSRKAIEFYIYKDGKLTETFNPENDFEFDPDTGELLNGVINFRLSTFNESSNKMSSYGYNYMKGANVPVSKVFDYNNTASTETSSKGLQLNVVTDINIPGLNSDLTINQEVTDTFAEYISDSNQANKDYDSLQNIIKDKDPKDINIEKDITDGSNRGKEKSATGRSTKTPTDVTEPGVKDAMEEEFDSLHKEELEKQVKESSAKPHDPYESSPSSVQDDVFDAFGIEMEDNSGEDLEKAREDSDEQLREAQLREESSNPDNAIAADLSGLLDDANEGTQEDSETNEDSSDDVVSTDNKPSEQSKSNATTNEDNNINMNKTKSNINELSTFVSKGISNVTNTTEGVRLKSLARRAVKSVKANLKTTSKEPVISAIKTAVLTRYDLSETTRENLINTLIEEFNSGLGLDINRKDCN